MVGNERRSNETAIHNLCSEYVSGETHRCVVCCLLYAHHHLAGSESGEHTFCCFSQSCTFSTKLLKVLALSCFLFNSLVCHLPFIFVQCISLITCFVLSFFRIHNKKQSFPTSALFSRYKPTNGLMVTFKVSIFVFVQMVVV